jgi:hypothetical protein
VTVRAVPDVSGLIRRYREEKLAVGAAPVLCDLYRGLADDARLLDRVADLLRAPRYERALMAAHRGPIELEVEVAILVLDDHARRCRMARSTLSPTDRRKASTLPGSPQRRFLEDLARAWISSGRSIGAGPGTGFYGWCRELFHEMGEAFPARLAIEVARAGNPNGKGQKTGSSVRPDQPGRDRVAPSTGVVSASDDPYASSRALSEALLEG